MGVMKDLYDGAVDIAKDIQVTSVPRSISSKASNAIYYFPVLTSRNMNPDTTVLLASNLEGEYMSFVQACFAMIPAMKVSGSVVDIESYLKKFHQNIGIQGSNELTFQFIRESFEEFPYFANDTLNEAPTYNATFTIKPKDNKYPNKTIGNIINSASDHYIGNGKSMDSQYITNGPIKSVMAFDESIPEKKNAMRPSVTKVSASFIMDGCGKPIKTEFLVGVKAVIHTINPIDLNKSIIDSLSNKGIINGLIRYTTGEMLSLGDILFGTSKMKKQLTRNSEIDQWMSTVEHRKRLSSISKAVLAKKAYLPNVSILLSMDDIRYIENETGFNLINQKAIAVKYMKNNFLLGLIVADDATETAYCLFDSHSNWEEYPYKFIKNSNKKNDDIVEALIKGIGMSNGRF